jgi:hypothetical protein
MNGERDKVRVHPWFAAVVGPRPSEQPQEEDEQRRRRRPPRLLKVRRTS